MRNHIISMTLLAVAACGGGQKTSGGGGGGGSVPPPPVVSKTPAPGDGGDAAPAAPKVEVSKDERNDYSGAYQFFAQNDKEGKWNEATCRSAADKFQSVASAHPNLVVAQVMVGTSFARCGLWGDAEKAFQQASRAQNDAIDAARALSNLGELYFMQGKVDGAKQYWDSALKASGKVSGAHIGLASLEIAQMHQINNPKDQKWKDLETDARSHLSQALGVDSDSVAAYTAYGLLYMEGWQQNKNRLDLAKLLLDEGKQRDEKYPNLQNAYGLYWMHRGALNQALAAFSAAVDADPKFVEARVNAGLLTLGFRKYDVAKDMFAKALEIQPKNYTAIIGLGIALRGLNDLDGAEKQYKLAEQVIPQRGDAYYNMGVLYKDFRANHPKSNDPIGSLQEQQGTYKQAREFFQQFMDKDATAADKQEAKNNIGDCEKVVKQLDNAIQSLKNAPPPPPPQPAAPAAPAGGAPAAGAGSAAAPAPAPTK
jgi:tetratricopeptide (TPR) repeat protein